MDVEYTALVYIRVYRRGGEEKSSMLLVKLMTEPCYGKTVFSRAPALKLKEFGLIAEVA